MDLFCGAGGTSLGAHWAGVKIVVAMNHWGLAVESHGSNFGDTVHVLGKAEWANLKALKGVDILMASPECTRHSTACGKLKWTPEAEGSRATAWQVYRYAKALKPRWLVVENVRQIKLWDDYDRWIRAIKRLGYNLREQILNAADFGVPQNRIRWFLLGDKERMPPEVQTRTKKHRPAWEVIDWSYPCPSIFSRRKALADGTMRRIMIGLERFCTRDALKPFITKMRTNNNPSDIEAPLGVIATGGHHALTIPYVVRLRNHSDAGSIDEPLKTVAAGGQHQGIVVPYMLKMRSNATVGPIEDPLNAITAGGGHHGVIMPYVMDVNHQGGDDQRVKGTDQPLGTVTTKRGTALIAPFVIPQMSGAKPRGAGETLPTVMANGPGGSVVVPFLVKYYRTGTAKSVAAPLDTITSKARFGLVGAMSGKPPKLPRRDKHGIVKFMREHGILDVGFRMLQPPELQRAMGFPDEYVIKGNKTETVKQLGNAVCPPVMRAIVETLCEVTDD
jgi:DNA (cytosine-5)-methyltransferase 1